MKNKPTRYLCHTFLPYFINDSKIILDCGANRGEFARWLSANSVASIYSFEPDPYLFEKLPPLERVKYINRAISGEDGGMKFAIGKNQCSSSEYIESSESEMISVEQTSLESFYKELGKPTIDFMKIDIEGSELSLFERTCDRTLQSVKQITVEFHDFMRPSDLGRIRKITGRLQDLGFYMFKMSYNNWGDVLFVNSAYIKLTFFEQMYLKVIGKYIPGIIRKIKRW